MLLRWLSGKLNNYDDAQDVLQSVYARAIAFSDANTIENAKALIFRVAARLAIDELRRRRRFIANHHIVSDEEAEDPLAGLSSNAPSIEQAMISREEYEAVMMALDTLPQKARTAFLMNRVYGFTYTEIASRLGVSVSSVEKYMIKALETLRLANPKRMSAESRRARRGEKSATYDFLSFAARRGR